MFTKSQSYKWALESHRDGDVALGENDSDVPPPNGRVKLLCLRIIIFF